MLRDGRTPDARGQGELVVVVGVQGQLVNAVAVEGIAEAGSVGATLTGLPGGDVDEVDASRVGGGQKRDESGRHRGGGDVGGQLAVLRLVGGQGVGDLDGLILGRRLFGGVESRLSRRKEQGG